MKETRILLLLVYFFVYLGGNHAYEDYFRKFQRKFEEKCSKYSFVQTYQRIMKELPDKYLIFVFHEDNVSNGGLGDRFAGLITAMAYAIRFNRMLLIKGDSGFDKSFKPFHFANESDEHYSWNNWGWSNWKDSYLQEKEDFLCVNPNRYSSNRCGFDIDYPNVKVMKMYSNRVYLCRWTAVESLGLQEEIKKSLNITLQTNLYDIAGCLFRLAMFPTKTLWKTLISSRENQFITKAQQLDHLHPAHISRANALQIGIHFRCGDSSFDAKDDQPANPQCLEIPGIEWKGTSFSDDFSLESPIHLAKCAQKKIDEFLSSSASSSSSSSSAKPLQPIVFIASDNRRSSKQMMEHISPDVPIFVPSSATCNVDLKRTNDCTLSTLAEWFLLSFSDMIITQQLHHYNPKSPYFDTNLMSYLQAPYPEELGPISAFSRFALIYGLNSEHLYHANCLSANTTTVGHYTHGNWMCFTKIFY
jgi:hypothetical protein